MDQVKYKVMPFEYKLARFSLLLLKGYPFFGELCMRVEKFRVEKRGLASTDGLRLFLNVEKLSELPEEALNFVLLHELFHIILRQRYPKEMQFYERLYWNIAFDLIANWLLMDMSDELKRNGLPIQPVAETALTSDDLSDDSSNVIAKVFVQQAVAQGILSKNPPFIVMIKWKLFEKVFQNDSGSFVLDANAMGGGGGGAECEGDAGADGDGEANDGGASGGASAYECDVLRGDEAEGAPNEVEVRELLESCEKIAGRDGLPQYIKDLWDDVDKGRMLPWYLISKCFLEGMKESEEFDFCPPDKRMLYSGMVLPAETMEDGTELNNALVVLDVSSSINREELLEYVWQIASILNELEFKGSIISFASKVHHEAALTNKTSLKKFIDELKVGGGTNWSDVVRYVKEKKRNAKPIVVFTDGYLSSFDEGLSDVVFITLDDCPDELAELGKVIQITK